MLWMICYLLAEYLYWHWSHYFRYHYSIRITYAYLSFSRRSTLLGFLSTIRSAIWNLAVGLTRLTSSTLNSYIPKLNCLSIELMGCVNTIESIVVYAITRFRKTKLQIDPLILGMALVGFSSHKKWKELHLLSWNISWCHLYFEDQTEDPLLFHKSHPAMCSYR